MVVGVCFFGSVFYTESQLSISADGEFEPTFDVTELIDIDKQSIFSEIETRKQGRMIEYNCRFKDSCVTVITVGCVADTQTPISEIVRISNTKPRERKNQLFVTMGPFWSYQMVEHYALPYYNVKLLPKDNIEQINIYMFDNNVPLVTINGDYEISYKCQSRRILINVNGDKYVDLIFSISTSQNLYTIYDSELIFKVAPNTGYIYAIILTKYIDKFGCVGNVSS